MAVLKIDVKPGRTAFKHFNPVSQPQATKNQTSVAIFQKA